jgi:hypothetical protein
MSLSTCCMHGTPSRSRVPNPVCPSRALRTDPIGGCVAAPAGPSWGWRCPSKRSRASVAAIRFTAPASSFVRPRGLSRTRQPTPERRRLPWAFYPPSGSDRISPAGTSRGSGGPHGVCRPYSDPDTGELREPGFQPRPGPPSGFLALLTVCSPPRLPAHGTGAAHGVHPAERFPSVEPYAFRRPCPLAVFGIAYSCSEDQKFTMPRSSRALLPTEVRTCRGPRPEQADALMGVLRLSRAVPTRHGPSFPGPSLLRFIRPTSRRPSDRRFKAWCARGQTGPSRDLPALLRFSTRTCPRFAPDDSGVLSE